MLSRVREHLAPGAAGAAGLLDAVQAVNRGRQHAAFALITHALDGNIHGRTIAFLGGAFKAGTSDVRDSPALRLADRLHQLGPTVRLFGPEALDNARRTPRLTYADSSLGHHRPSRPRGHRHRMARLHHRPETARRSRPPRHHRTVTDVRNALDAGPWLAAGWTVHQMGRPTRTPDA
ncbi:UDP binding domain-containing protein [Streptomyces sp. CB01881]|uniref:UDP binding domain-containing protein n=1 Tax=Streptomyces sp. CB01881 TaxID=2078691 RepID=UPI000CDC60B8|nr:UDP binding domain-containing protein [Streptomyces sp. CB01881]AUY53746.1 hypothetical protein C2142_38535 [Streptomyces sp. CB01881]TYC68756.1 hypothetical protein EH183_38530 [Streptomyces sp. CB01881]